MHVFVFVCSCADKWKCGTSGRNMRVVEKRFSRVMMICLIQFGEPSYWLKAISYIVLERTATAPAHVTMKLRHLCVAAYEITYMNIYGMRIGGMYGRGWHYGRLVLYHTTGGQLAQFISTIIYGWCEIYNLGNIVGFWSGI